MRKALAAFLMFFLLLPCECIPGLGSRKAGYQGGTTRDRDFHGVQKAVEGYLVTDSETELQFEYSLNERNKPYSIPYRQFIDIEYGQKAGRRVGDSAMATVLYSPVNLFRKLSKKRNHYITVGYIDEAGKEQIAVFELGKDIVLPILHILESRSGTRVQFQDEGAAKSGEEVVSNPEFPGSPGIGQTGKTPDWTLRGAGGMGGGGSAQPAPQSRSRSGMK